MATPAASSSGSGAVNITKEGAATRHERFEFGLTFKDYEEVPLYFKWLSLPHPELYLDYHLAEVRHIGSVQVPTPYMKAEVAAVINKEQEGRFKSIAEVYDIQYVYHKLYEFKAGMEEMRGVLDIQLEDEMADFNAEDFKEMAKEDEMFRQARKKD